MRGDRGVKRFNDGYGGGAPKRSKLGPDEIEIRVLIPSKVAGSIIGKGGNNIARLRTDAKVTIPDCPGPERVLSIIAQQEPAVKVVNEILPNLFTYQGGRRGDNDEVDLRVLIHQSQAGCIIGKGGSKVKELREKTGSKVRIWPNCCPDSTDRIVHINGAPNTAIDCLKEVLELLKETPIKGVENPYDPNNFDEFYADEYGGYGAGGGPPSGGGRGFGGRGEPAGRGPPPRFGGGGGGGGSRSGGPGGRGGPVDRGYDGGYGDDYDYDPPPRGSVGLGNGSNYSRTSTQVTIPKDLAGAIIGTGGARIRKVRMDSGADIVIDEPLPGSSDRIITITGNSNQIQMAQYLLQQCVHQNAKGGARGRY